MRRLSTLAAIPLLALALAGPARAQPAAGDETAPKGQAVVVVHVIRIVSARTLMTVGERRALRRQMEDATPEQQRQIWRQKAAELEHRAALRGFIVAELRFRPAGDDEDDSRGQVRRGAGDPGRAEAAVPVSARNLMTREERRTFRHDMENATPEQQAQLWRQEAAELKQRAAPRGFTVAETQFRPDTDDDDDDSGPVRRGIREPAPGESGQGGTLMLRRFVAP